MDLYSEYDAYFEIQNGSVGDLAKAIEEEAPNMVTFTVILTVWSFIVNMTFIISILSDTHARQKVSYLQIVNISATNVLESVLILPLTIYYELQPWMLGQALCKAYIMLDVILPFIAGISLIIADILHLIHQFNKNSPPTISYNLRCLSLVLPWLFGIFIVSTMWTLGDKTSEFIPGLCWFMLNFEASIMSPLLTFFIPSVLCICFTIIILVSNFKRQLDDPVVNHNQTRTTNTYHHTTRNRRDFSLSAVSLSLANLIWVALWFPHKFITFQMPFCSQCFPPLSIVVAFVYIGAASIGILPLAWLVDAGVRLMLKNQITGYFTRKQNSDNSNIIDLEEITNLNS